jgi:hypothetical protein
VFEMEVVEFNYDSDTTVEYGNVIYMYMFGADYFSE